MGKTRNGWLPFLAILLPGFLLLTKKRYGLALLYITSLFFPLYLFGWSRLYSSPGWLSTALVLGLVLHIGISIYCLRREKYFPTLSISHILMSGLLSAVCVIFFLLFTLRYSAVLIGYRLYYVPSQSMMPALLPGDYVLVESFSGKNSVLKKGDIIVFQHPYKPGAVFIKRIAFVPDETFLGKPLDKNQFAVVGDNADSSEDSRHFGPIFQSSILGRAHWVAFSWDGQSQSVRWTRVGHMLTVF